MISWGRCDGQESEANVGGDPRCLMLLTAQIEQGNAVATKAAWKQKDATPRTVMHITWIDWVIVVASILICFVPALFLAKRSSGSTAEFFASGRSVPTPRAGPTRGPSRSC